jgi:HK97 gp10 family phage protein
VADRVEVKLTGVDNVLNLLQSLPKEVVSKRGGPVRAALRKGAKVIHTQQMANLAAVTANLTDEGEKLSTGLLAKNVVISRGKAPFGGKGERVLIRVRRKSYPDRTGKTVTTHATANWTEYGTSERPAEPWIRPAFLAKAEQAIHTTTAELLNGIDRIVQKLSKGR